MEATCTWPDHDVLITLDGTHLIMYEEPQNTNPPFAQYVHGYVTKGSIGLTSYEAKKLAYQLLAAANKVYNIEKGYTEYTENS